MEKKTYYIVKWEYFMGRGEIIVRKMTPEELEKFNRDYVNAPGDPCWSVYDNWLTAQNYLDRRYCD